MDSGARILVVLCAACVALVRPGFHLCEQEWSTLHCTVLRIELCVYVWHSMNRRVQAAHVNNLLHACTEKLRVPCCECLSRCFWGEGLN